IETRCSYRYRYLYAISPHQIFRRPSASLHFHILTVMISITTLDDLRLLRPEQEAALRGDPTGDLRSAVVVVAGLWAAGWLDRRLDHVHAGFVSTWFRGSHWEKRPRYYSRSLSAGLGSATGVHPRAGMWG